MEFVTKKDFKYAALYNPEKEEYCTDSSEQGLVMDPETAKRYEENDDCAVTICCITYKHEEYIAQALDSFLMQKTNFKFKIFVGEDHGPDGTADIIREYAAKYPDIVVPFLREENMGAQANLIDLCNHATSPYIAFCEGDDYWTDANKLQKQFDYMQANPKLRVCFTRTKIEAPEDWHLRSYYQANKDGEMIMPEAIPGFKMPKGNLKAVDLISAIPIHTSTHFYRWNYGLELPDWYYKGVEGAFPILMMQMGLGEAKILPDVTSVYRRSDVGVLMNTSTAEHFLKTRLDYIRFLWDLHEYFREHYGDYCRIQFENRIKAEGYNLLTNAIRYEDQESIQKFFTLYPEASRIALGAYLSFYNDARGLTRACTWEGYKLIVRKRIYRYGLRPYAMLARAVEKCRRGVRAVLKKIRDFLSFLCYWIFALVPEKKNLWVFTSFHQRIYMDNAKYYYEYVLEHHPEIEAVWLTRNENLYENLKEAGKRVYKTGTFKAWWKLVRAKVAVTDHFRMSDYTCLAGFNHGTKVLQLWHGVGFKSMGDGTQVKNTDVRGVRYSYDLIPQPGDSLLKRIRKHIKYFFCACNREMFEDYFMFVCPGQERIDMIGKMWNIPENRYFMAGHPRNLPLYEHEVSADEPKILYAPTYRMDAGEERIMIDLCLNSVVEIQEAMEQIGGSFVIRLHPHTWRNYQTEILNRIRPYDRISLDTKKDVYQSLGQYSIVISDYSSISLDFAMLDRPVIYFCFDYDRFIKNDAGFNLDFKSCTPGPIVYTWEETLQKVKEYTADPSKDRDWCRERCRYFFDQSVNNAQNSERITEELKRRLHIS